jgi:hypothetical protein
MCLESVVGIGTCYGLGGIVFVVDKLGEQSCIGTCYGLDVWGLNPLGGEIVRTFPDRLWDPPIFLYSVYRVHFWE